MRGGKCAGRRHPIRKALFPFLGDIDSSPSNSFFSVSHLSSQTNDRMRKQSDMFILSSSFPKVVLGEEALVLLHSSISSCFYAWIPILLSILMRKYLHENMQETNHIVHQYKKAHLVGYLQPTIAIQNPEHFELPSIDGLLFSLCFHNLAITTH